MGPLYADSSNGSIDVRLGQAFTGSVKCSTTNGTVDYKDSQKRAKRSDIRGKKASIILPGSGESIIKTTNGNIRLVFQ